MPPLLQVHAGSTFVLEVGSWEEKVSEAHEPYRLVLPPAKSMYQQVIDYLGEETKAEKAPPKSALDFQEVTLATLAVCFKWGSYLSVLTDKDLLMWSANDNGEISAIGDSEMARINIEISSAVCQWLNLMHTDPALFRKLVKAAGKLLPPLSPVTFDMQYYKQNFRHLTFFNSKSGREDLLRGLQETIGNDYLQRERERLSGHIIRALANGVVNETYRNGLIENVHAGVGEGRRYLPRPLTQRRISAFAEYEVLRETGNRLFPILHGLYKIITKDTGETLDEKLFPYAVLFKPPHNWSFTEETRVMKAPDSEPEQ